MTNKIIKFENLAKIRKKYKDKKIILPGAQTDP